MRTIPRQYAVDYIMESAQIIGAISYTQVGNILLAADTIAHAFSQGNKLLICGNGGSAADAQHLAAEFVSRYRKTRQALPAIALTTDTSLITAHSNDFGFVDIFSRQVEALGKPGDILIGISTSGNSANVMRAITTAQIMHLRTIGFCGENGFGEEGNPSTQIRIPSKVTSHIQEGHIVAYHIMTDLVEKILYET